MMKYENMIDNNIHMYPLYVSKNLDTIDVISKYSDSKDIRIQFKKTGNNRIFNFAGIYLIDNDKLIASTNVKEGSALVTMGTDWFGPHIVLAKNNIDGDLPDSIQFTGGNHAYNKDATGTYTGRTVNVFLYVDGRKKDTYCGFANYIDIYWSNRIQASNTKKADGTGREVLQENYHMHYDGYKWDADCSIEFLEDATWKTYYGIQCVNEPWNDFIFYHSSPNRKWNIGTKDSSCGNKTCNLVTLKKGLNYLDMFIDNTIGIGNREFLSCGHGCFTKDYFKTYFNLIKNADFKAHDVVSFKGGYRFYTK